MKQDQEPRTWTFSELIAKAVFLAVVGFAGYACFFLFFTTIFGRY